MSSERRDVRRGQWEVIKGNMGYVINVSGAVSLLSVLQLGCLNHYLKPAPHGNGQVLRLIDEHFDAMGGTEAFALCEGLPGCGVAFSDFSQLCSSYTLATIYSACTCTHTHAVP